jgi:2-dehydro-3-deoxyphosphogluconate aldolase/(4S)-4-hydroxy-2-oxoglutarate aldolase
MYLYYNGRKCSNSEDHMNITETLTKAKVVPVIVVSTVEEALMLGEIFVECELNVAEITFRSEAAAPAIAALKKKFPNLCVGAGTLLTRYQFKAAQDAGSDFFVSPGFNPKNAEYAVLNNLKYFPGVTNPSLVEQALEMGLTELKFFPAELSGGVKMLKAMGSVYPNVMFMPTGGITLENLTNYLSLTNVIACGGSWMVKKEMIGSNDWDKIKTLVCDTVDQVKSLEQIQ